MAANHISNQKQDIEHLLRQGRSVRIHPQGYSMYPMFVPDRDEAVISPIGKIQPKRGDVVLYRREGSILVLHRIWKVTSAGIYLVGDNQTELEGPLDPRQLRGILTSFIRKGREVSVHHPIYLLCSRLWLILRPFRHKIAMLLQSLQTAPYTDDNTHLSSPSAPSGSPAPVSLPDLSQRSGPHSES